MKEVIDEALCTYLRRKRIRSISNGKGGLKR